MLRAINPADDRIEAEYPELTPAELDRALERAEHAAPAWAAAGFATRGRILEAVADRLLAQSAEHAARMAREMGKPVAQGVAEVEKCAWVCRYYASEAEALLRDEPVEVAGAEAFITHPPLGVVLAIMPWNFPFWQVWRAAAPALLAGNAVALKHASNVPGCAAALACLWEEAGGPPGVFTNLPIGSALAAQAIAHPAVQAVTFTGSTSAGRAVAATAGQHLKKTVLELGGSDPYLVLADADLARAARACVSARLVNGGQSCIAAKRFLVVREVAPAFAELVAAELAAYPPADPLLPATRLGPLARREIRDELHGQVARSVAAGAQLVLGGAIPDRPGAWYPPTLLTGVRPGQPAFDEETFGPVAALVPVRDEEEAVAWANRSPYGLGAAVFTADPARGRRLARERLAVGCCFVNAAVRSDPRLPFGGIRASGYGRELGRAGLREFINRKTVWVES